ncbi:MAG TPA: Npt1/Npt2 family nucleotide transporter [Kofleriaceae bacterium]
MRSVFPVKRGEALTVALLAFNVFTLLLSYYVLKVVREPLILLGGGAELKSYASAGQTILLLGVVPAFGWLASRVSRIRLLTIMQLIFIGCLVAFYLLAQAKAPIGLAFYIWLGIFNALVVSNFWSFANDLYTEEEGKRLFALIGIGASIGAIIGAFLPHVLEPILKVHGLMALAVGCLVLSIFLYRIVDHRESARANKEVPSAKEEKPDKSGGFGMVIKDRYLRLIAFMLLSATVVNSVGEYVIGKMATGKAEAYAKEKMQASGAAPTPDTPAKAEPAKVAAPDGKPAPTAKDQQKELEDHYLSKFYSDYYGLVNLVGFILQAFIVAKLLTWLGIRKALFIMPVIVFGGWFALAIFLTTSLVRIEKTAENSMDYSLHNTLRQALFLPTSKEAKYKAKAAIDTFFFRMGDVLQGILVFVLAGVLGLGLHVFAVANVALAGVWLFLVWRTGIVHDERVAEHEKLEKHEQAV